MAIPIPDDVRELLQAPNYVHLSTLRADGSPRNWVVWAGPEDDRILVCTSDAIAKAKDMRRDPASLSLPGPVRSSGVGQLCQPCSAAQIVQFWECRVPHANGRDQLAEQGCGRRGEV